MIHTRMSETLQWGGLAVAALVSLASGTLRLDGDSSQR